MLDAKVKRWSEKSYNQIRIELSDIQSYAAIHPRIAIDT